MLKRTGFSFLVVMLAVFGMSFLTANNAAAANYFPAAKAPTFIPGGGFGGNSTGGVITGITNGAATNVYVNPDGLGQALIYGYYNVKSDFANLFTITNTADYGVRARVRFIEAKNSNELLDFDVCLSKHDVWTSYLLNVPNAAGDGAAYLFSLDSDTPVDYGDSRGAKNGIFTEKFPNGIALKYDGTVVTQEMTLEGYFIVIAENQLLAGDAAGTTGTNEGTDLCGKKGDVGPDAGMNLNDDITLTLDGAADGTVGNVLFGTNILINLTSGKSYGYTATALADFSDAPLLNSPTSADPNLGSATTTGIDGATQAGGAAVGTGLGTVNMVLTKSMVMAPYYKIGNGTQIIVTFPTKSLTVVDGDDDIFDNTGVDITVYSDKEESKVAVCEFSPCDVATASSLPNEVNVVTVGGGSVFSSAVEKAIAADYVLGWISFDLVNALGAATAPSHDTAVTRAAIGAFPATTVTANGLPAIGYVVTDMTGGWNWMMPLFSATNVTAE